MCQKPVIRRDLQWLQITPKWVCLEKIRMTKTLLAETSRKADGVVRVFRLASWAGWVGTQTLLHQLRG